MTTQTEPSRTGAIPSQPRLTRGRLVAIIGSLAFAAFVMILNETVLTVALPALMHEFNITAATGGWLTTGFMLTMAVVIPTTGYLLSRFSPRNIFLVAIAFFLVGSFLAAVAPNFAVMLLARIVQACGTAIIMPLMMTTSLRLVPAHQRGTIMGLNSVVISVGPAIGPTVAGLIVSASGWRTIFWCMIPLVIIAGVIGAFVLERQAQGVRGRLDAASILLSIIGFGGFVYGISNLAAIATGDLVPVVVLVVGIVGLTLFVHRQQRLANGTGAPLLNLAPFKVRDFRLSVIVVAIAFGTMLGSTVILPVELQDARGLEAFEAGLLLLPGGLIQAIMSPLAGRLYDKRGPLACTIPGVLLLAVGQWLLVATVESAPVAWTAIAFTIFGTGMSFTMAAMMTHSLSTLPGELYSHGSAIINTVQQLAGALGTTIFLAVFALGASASFVVGGVLTTLALGIIGFIRRPAAA